MTNQTFVITDTDILDNTHADENGNINPSEISISVTIELDQISYTLDFQTTATHDYGAYSSKLESYSENSDHMALGELFDDEDKFIDFLDDIKTVSNAEKQWHEYVNENYIVSADDFDGIDANSETNAAALKVTQNTIKTSDIITALNNFANSRELQQSLIGRVIGHIPTNENTRRVTLLRQDGQYDMMLAGASIAHSLPDFLPESWGDDDEAADVGIDFDAIAKQTNRIFADTIENVFESAGSILYWGK